MKKLFLIAILMLALVMTAVACNKASANEDGAATTTANSPETTAASGNSDGSETTVTPETTADSGTSDAEETTVDDEPAALVNKSYEVFFVNGKSFFSADDMATNKLAEANHTVTTAEGEPCKSIALRGWIGLTKPIAAFGYSIDGGKTVFSDGFKAVPEETILQVGGEHASRFVITADMTGLEPGEHKVVFVARLENGTEFVFYDKLTVVITTAAPTDAE